MERKISGNVLNMLMTPAAATRMSTAPKVFSASEIMPAIWSGLDMSAAE